MKIKLIVLLCMMQQVVVAQNNSINSIIDKIEFSQDTVASVYKWVADNIRYDVQKLKRIQENGKNREKSKFNSIEEHKADLLKKVIKTKKGVCEDYALLFNSLLSQLGYTSYIVEGYTKNNKGKINLNLGHAWNVVLVNGEWKLYDATWGAGSVKDNKKFIKKYKPKWLDVNPIDMLLTHMPYDPVWQLSNNPISYQDFKENTTLGTLAENFDYKKEASDYFTLDENGKMKAQLERSELCGEGIRIAKKWQKTLKDNMEVKRVVGTADDYKDAERDYNEAVDLLNDYLKAKSKRFKGQRHSLSSAEKKLTLAEEKVRLSMDIVTGIQVDDKRLNSALRQALRHNERLLRQIEKEKRYIEKMK